MVELRWFTRKTGEQVINKYGFFEDGKVTVLQYRQKIDTTIRAGGPGTWNSAEITRTANYQWSDWHDVPTVIEDIPKYTPTTLLTDNSKCPKCGLSFNGTMGYVCSQVGCPNGLGSATSL